MYNFQYICDTILKKLIGKARGDNLLKFNRLMASFSLLYCLEIRRKPHGYKCIHAAECYV